MISGKDCTSAAPGGILEGETSLGYTNVGRYKDNSAQASFELYI